jgi:predicted S18 family serine protease
MDLRQFKLGDNEEIICEVVEWPDEEHDTMVVRRALKIIAVEDIAEGMRYYTFKPWMSMNNDPEQLQVLNSYHIIAEAKPSTMAIDHYNDIISEMKDFDAEENANYFGNEVGDSDQGSNIIQFSKDLIH